MMSSHAFVSEVSLDTIAFDGFYVVEKDKYGREVANAWMSPSALVEYIQQAAKATRVEVKDLKGDLGFILEY